MRAGRSPRPSGSRSDVVVGELDDPPEPRDALARCAGLPGRVLLESAGGRGSYSFLGCDPILVLRVKGGRASLAGNLELTNSPSRAGSHDPFLLLGTLLNDLRGPSPPPGIPFAGGIVGYLAYELADLLERLPAPPADDVRMPDAWFGVYDGGLVWDHPSGRCRAVATELPGGSGRDASSRVRALLDLMRGGPRTPEVWGGTATRITSSLSRTEYRQGVERIREYIRAGDLFQANLTRRISAYCKGLSGRALYDALARQSPAAFGAFLDVGDGEVASISPELFLSLRGDRVRTRPIKGTARRDPSEKRDRALRDELAASAKDRAENVMIVDLLRNDLSRVAQPGSVVVPELAELETHPTVHHLVSTVEGRLMPDRGRMDLLKATFPGGSISGAPKIRAMEILRELEPVRRGVYTGALGILGFHGDLDLSIAIRTAVLRDGWVRYGTGGGITLASDPEAEWQESRDKATAFLRALGVGEER